MKNMKENKQGNGQSRSISGSRTPLGYAHNKHQTLAFDNPTHSFKITNQSKAASNVYDYSIMIKFLRATFQSCDPFSQNLVSFNITVEYFVSLS
jgi:hypothetical protein